MAAEGGTRERQERRGSAQVGHNGDYATRISAGPPRTKKEDNGKGKNERAAHQRKVFLLAIKTGGANDIPRPEGHAMERTIPDPSVHTIYSVCESGQHVCLRCCCRCCMQWLCTHQGTGTRVMVYQSPGRTSRRTHRQLTQAPGLPDGRAHDSRRSL